MDKLSIEEKNQFEQGLVETVLYEHGIPTYIIKNGLSLETYVGLAKRVLEEQREIAHDFTGFVTNEEGTETLSFEYKSGWFLEGLQEEDPAQADLP